MLPSTAPNIAGPEHANAAHIVKCVNAHDELVAALYACAEVFADLPPMIPECKMTRANALARAALAKVQA